MSMTALLDPILTEEFDSLVSGMDPSARSDFIFITIVVAICFMILPNLDYVTKELFPMNKIFFITFFTNWSYLNLMSFTQDHHHH